MNAIKLICLLAIFAAAPAALAQVPAGQGTPNNQTNNQNTQDPENLPFEDKEDHKRFWNASIGGGNYLVALDRIANISKHQYLLDGTLIVTEVTIDTVGNSLARFYHITPAAENSPLATPRKVIERANDLLDRAGQRTGTDFEQMVHKKYPVTTHAKTVEFRVMEAKTLDALYGSVSKAWILGRGRVFRVR